MKRSRPALLAVLTALSLVASGCDEERREGVQAGGGGGPGGGPGTTRCQSNDDCEDPAPFCVGGSCSATHGIGNEGGAGDAEGADEEPPNEGGDEGGSGLENGEGDEGGGDEGVGPGDGALCSVCQGGVDGECGDDGNCMLFQDQTKYCSAPCADDDTCQPGFDCVAGFDPPRCLPISGVCRGNCSITGCEEAGQVCDFARGVCQTPKGHCEECVADEECDNGNCTQLQEGMYCVQACAEGAEGDCPAASACANGLCLPDEEICDRCDGVDCAGLTPFCDPAEGECVACLTDQDCGQGSFCALGECREAQGECLSNGDCAGNPEGPHCFVDRCVECIAIDHCPPRSRCDANVCVAALCEGLLCQGGAACNDQTGKCDPSCEQTGCLDAQECDQETGQCYNSDGSCDAESPCRPGSVCGAGGGFPPDPQQGASCTCPSPGGPFCQDDAECNPPFVCDGGPFCKDQCEQDGDCPAGWSCTEILGGLIKVCRAHSWCHPGIECNGASCGGGAL